MVAQEKATQQYAGTAQGRHDPTESYEMDLRVWLERPTQVVNWQVKDSSSKSL
ncbi:3554_t:CDS:1, partial [Acaulospora colombiana]